MFTFTSKHNCSSFANSCTINSRNSIRLSGSSSLISWTRICLKGWYFLQHKARNTGMADIKLPCSLAGQFLWTSVECFQIPSRCCCISAIARPARKFSFWILAVSSNRFLHFHTVDDCNDTLKSRLAHFTISRSLSYVIVHAAIVICCRMFNAILSNDASSALLWCVIVVI